MVSLSRGNRRGGSTVGCLVSLLVLVAAIYYGFHIGEIYLRYYQLLDEMRTNARQAPNLADEVIQRRLQAKVRDVFGDSRSIRFRVARGGRTPVITIEAEYRDSVDLPLFKRTFVLKPKVEEPL